MITPHTDLFLSYHWRDHAVIEALAHRLTERGLRVFLARWHLFPGKPWRQALEERIGDAGAVAVMVGSSGLGPWQQREAYLALGRQAREPGFPVIPVLIDRSDPPLGFLSFNTWVDLRGGVDDREAMDVLAAAARGELLDPGRRRAC
jgi:hypothetical protein